MARLALEHMVCLALEPMQSRVALVTQAVRDGGLAEQRTPTWSRGPLCNAAVQHCHLLITAAAPCCLFLQGITGSFSGVDASGRFKQATLQLGGGSASGGGKPNGGGAAGPGPASGGTGRASGGGARSGGSSLGYGFGAQQQQQPAKKKKIFDADGAWNGCCFCGVRAKVSA